MKFLAVLALLFLAALPLPYLQAEPIPGTGTAEVFFSPHGGTEAAIVQELTRAKREILIQAYSFTNPRIAKAIIEARKRGVRIEAVLDSSNLPDQDEAQGKKKRKLKYSAALFLFNQGIPVLMDSAHPIAHNKIIIIDGETVITGSYNFSTAAERNAENLLILKGNPDLVKRYLANFEAHKSHSEPYSR